VLPLQLERLVRLLKGGLQAEYQEYLLLKQLLLHRDMSQIKGWLRKHTPMKQAMTKVFKVLLLLQLREWLERRSRGPLELRECLQRRRRVFLELPAHLGSLECLDSRVLLGAIKLAATGAWVGLAATAARVPKRCIVVTTPARAFPTALPSN
jgi:hypothetical protein